MQDAFAFAPDGSMLGIGYGVVLVPRGAHKAGKSRRAALLLCCALAACENRTVSSAEKSSASQAAAPAVTEMLSPGLYRIVQTGDVGGEVQRCFTADQIAAGEFGRPNDLPHGWTVERNRLSDGVIDFEASGPSNGRMVQKGRYTADAFTADAVFRSDGNGQSVTIHNVVHGTLKSPTCKGSASE